LKSKFQIRPTARFLEAPTINKTLNQYEKLKPRTVEKQFTLK